MTLALEDYFRLSPGDVPYEVPKSIDGAVGFFRFSSASPCYGRVEGVSPATTAAGIVPDTQARLDSSGQAVEFPFDPDDVVAQLLNEAYAPPARDAAAAKRAIRQIYYALRPLMPVSFRRHLQRRALADWKTIPFPGWPSDCTVDQFLRNVLAAILQARGVQRVPFIWFWPNGHRACALLTHDVETDAGQRFCPELMSMNEEFGFRGSFQFVPEVRYAKRPDVHAQVRDRGHEINLHGLNHDGRLFQDRDEFLRRARKINEYARDWGAKGFRSPVLYRRQAWFDALEFDYDMSVPTTGRLEAQRGGCCTLMPYFIGNLVELPTTGVEDYTLFHILQDYATDVWRRQIDTAIEFNGLFNLIAHPDYLIDARARHTYRTFLAELRDAADTHGIWCPLPREAAAWWRARNAMRLVREGSAVRIHGDPDGRARIAYASIENSGLALEVSQS